MKRKNKNALTDENKLLIYSIIDFLLEHGSRQAFFDSDGDLYDLTFITSANDHGLLYKFRHNKSSVLTAIDCVKDAQYRYLVEGVDNDVEDEPEKVIEVARKMGVIND